jgi:hypothetical protein
MERIAGETVAAGDGTYLLEPALGALVLRYGDGAVERDHW